MPLELPEASTHLPPDVTTPALTISIKDDGTWWVSGSAVDAPALAGVLASYRDRNGDDALVRIRTDRSVEYERVEPVLSEAAKAGLANVSIAVYTAPTAARG